MKPYSRACERNQEPILEKLRHHFASVKQVLEVGSGTGQHAVYFARNLPHLIWQTADVAENHRGIGLWLQDAVLENLRQPLELNLNQWPWPVSPGTDAIFTANTLHIVAWPLVVKFLQGAGRVLPPSGIMCIYGPFNYDGGFTSESNAQFQYWLQNRDPQSGIRDFEAVSHQAAQQGFRLEADHAMPANNRLLVFHKDA